MYPTLVFIFKLNISSMIVLHAQFILLYPLLLLLSCCSCCFCNHSKCHCSCCWSDSQYTSLSFGGSHVARLKQKWTEWEIEKLGLWRQWGFDVQQDERIPEKPKHGKFLEYGVRDGRGCVTLTNSDTSSSHITRRSFSKSKFHVTNHLTYLTSPPLSSRSLVFFVSSARSYLIYTVIRRYMSCCNCCMIFPQPNSSITVPSTKLEGWLASF